MPVYELTSPSATAEERPFDTPRPDQDFVSGMQAELDQWYASMRDFDEADIVAIFVCLAAFSARASEVRSRIFRVDNRRLNAFRTRELDPFLEEVDRQFKVWSRIQAVKAMEWDIAKGGT